MGARKIIVAMPKGGAGKTATAVTFARGLARTGKAVLLVDLDPQGSATAALGATLVPPSSYAVSDLLLRPTKRFDPVPVAPGLHLIPSQEDGSLEAAFQKASHLAGLAALLAVVGLHGVLAFVVARRTREIGLRVALGAEPGKVIRLVLREMVVAVLAGIAAGVAAGLLSGRYVESQLFGVKAGDPPVFAISAGALLAVSLAAALIPAWRASRIDPMRALRHE